MSRFIHLAQRTLKLSKEKIGFGSFSREQLIEPYSSYYFLFDCFHNMTKSIAMQFLGYSIIRIKYDVEI